MASFKIVMSRKDGKSFQREVQDADAEVFLGKKIGDKVSGDDFGLAGYEFEIKGGSDSAGFPMRWDIDGTMRKAILAVTGVGLKAKRKGQRQRKTVAGNTVFDKIAQINLKIIKEGKEKLDAAPEPAADAKPEEKAEEKPAEKAADAKADEGKTEKKEEVKKE